MRIVVNLGCTMMNRSMIRCVWSKNFSLRVQSSLNMGMSYKTSVYCNCICLSTFCSVTVGVFAGWVSCARKPLKMNCSSSIYTGISMLSTWWAISPNRSHYFGFELACSILVMLDWWLVFWCVMFKFKLLGTLVHDLSPYLLPSLIPWEILLASI